MTEPKYAIYYNETYEPYFIEHGLTRELLVEWLKKNTYYPLDELDIYRDDNIPDIYELYKEAHE